MFNWFRKKKAPKKPSAIILHGRYELKPILGRALPYIMGVDQTSFTDLVATRQISLNDSVLTEDRISERLESGNYTIRHSGNDTSWQFFIK